MNGMNIISLNARGLGDNSKRKEVFYWLYKQNSDIIFLQETHSSVQMESIWRTQWGGDIYYSHGETNARGVAILIKKSSPITVKNQYKDDYGRYVILDVTIADKDVTLVNLYGPNEDKPEFFLELINNIENLPNDNRIIGGDFNLVLDKLVDKSGGRMITHEKCTEVVLAWMQETDLLDIWRHQHPLDQKYTWLKRRPQLIQCRLDFFLVSFGLANTIDKSQISPGFKTDHSLVKISLVLFDQKRGPGFWKLNCSLLKDLDYVKIIKQTIQHTVEEYETENCLLKWEMIKMNIRTASIQYASKKKRYRDEIIKLLQTKINDLSKRFVETQNDSILNTLDDTKNELENRVQEFTNGALIRSRVQWFEEGEKPTKYFLNLEKRNHNLKLISRLQLDNGEITTDNDRILNAQEYFYSQLYTSKIDFKIEDFNEFATFECPKLSEEHKVTVDEQLNEQDILRAMKETKNNRAPGNDGIPVDFYKVFWNDLRIPFMELLHYSFTHETLSISQKQGIISLLPKKDKNCLLLKNWRPLTLLNADYKLLAKAVANKLKLYLDALIHRDQTGFMKGRYIGENVVRLMDIMHYTDMNDIPAILMQIDFEKAFDSIEWKFIDQTLITFNFGPGIRNWVKLLYTNISACVMNNGWTSNYFKISRGVRQGCPLSPYLFTLCAEILALKIRSDDKLKGIVIGDKEFRISQFADDTSLTLLYNQQNLDEVVFIFDKFYHLSGLKVNYDKTEILRIGSLKNSVAKFVTAKPFKWTNDPISVLGIVLSTDMDDLFDLNYIPQYRKIENLIKVWKQRILTLYGKVTLINSLLLSQLIYKFSMLPTPPPYFLADVQKELSQFLWHDKRPKIKKDVLYNNLQNGGIRMTEITNKNKAIKTAWVPRLLNSIQNNSAVHTYLQASVSPINLEILLTSNIKCKDVQKLIQKPIHTFWMEVLETWSNCIYHEPLSKEQVLEEKLWLNSHITINKSILYWPTFIDSNILKVKDLLNPQGTWCSYNEFRLRYNDIRCTYVEYYGLISAIPVLWKRLLTNGLPAMVKSPVQVLLNSESISKSAYQLLMEKCVGFPHHLIQKWSADLNQEITMDKLKNSFSSLYKITISCNLRAFQFKFLHRILPTNHLLKIWQIKDSDTCSFCGQDIETLMHLFYNCHITRNFWLQVKEWIRSESGITFDFNVTDVMMLTINETIPMALLNVLLIAKVFIYKCKQSGSIPFIFNFDTYISQYIKIEESIAKKRDRILYHYKKWQMFDRLNY